MLSIIIPCHNEEESIAGVVRDIKKHLEGKAEGKEAEIIVVDNNCTDATAPLAREEGARVISESRPGYGAALKAGFAAAQGDIIVTLDGDGQYPPEKITELCAQLTAPLDKLGGGIDFISASRFPVVHKDSFNFTRAFGNWFLTLAANIILGIRLKDSQSGMWIFKRACLERFAEDPRFALQSNDMPLSEEIKIKAIFHPDIGFQEAHIPYYPRGGESKLSPIRHGIMNLLFLWRLRRELS